MKKFLSRNKKKLYIAISTLIFATYAKTAQAATGNLADLDSVIKFVSDWVFKFGLIVAFFGGIQLAMGFRNDDADSKVRGIRVVVAGFMVAAVSRSLNLFGL